MPGLFHTLASGYLHWGQCIYLHTYKLQRGEASGIRNAAARRHSTQHVHISSKTMEIPSSFYCERRTHHHILIIFTCNTLYHIVFALGISKVGSRDPPFCKIEAKPPKMYVPVKIFTHFHMMFTLTQTLPYFTE